MYCGGVVHGCPLGQSERERLRLRASGREATHNTAAPDDTPGGDRRAGSQAL